MSSDFQKQHIPALCLDQRRMIFEDRLKVVLEHLKRFQPTGVVSTLGAISFETLRYLPPGVFRVGVGQSEDPLVYEMMPITHRTWTLWPWFPRRCNGTRHHLPEFARIPIHNLSCGVIIWHDSVRRIPT